jgi:two-component sensor histidine kinase
MLQSLRARLFGLVLVASLPAIAIQTINEIDLRRQRTADLHRQALTQTRLAASDLGRLLEGARQTLVALSSSTAIRTLDAKDCNAQLQQMRPLYPAYVAMIVYDLQDHAVCSSSGPIMDATDDDLRTLNANARRMGFQVGSYRTGPISGKRVLPLAYPVVQDGRVIGSIFLSLGLDWLAGELQRIVHDAGVSLAVTDNRYTVLARVPEVPGSVGNKMKFNPGDDRTRDGTVERAGLDGRWRVYGYVPNDPRLYGLTVTLGVERQPAFVEINRSTLRGVLLIIAGLAATLGLVALISRRLLTQPIERLAAAARGWREGALEQRAEPQGADELVDLAHAFNAMAARVEDTVHRQEMVLREVDHRVMNGFQLLSSLLAIQRRGVKDPAVIRELELVEQRVHALALVHARLHHSASFTEVDVGPYLTELVRDLGQSLLPDDAQRRLSARAVNVMLPVRSATALGMVAVELLTNACKNVDAADPSTEIQLAFEHGPAGKLRLIVRDNGRGLPPGFDPAQSSGLGMRLIQVLARQLGGQLDWRSDAFGTQFDLEFPADSDRPGPTTGPAPS